MTVSSANFQPAYVERARVINVNVDDWTVDCVSEYGNKRFLDIQVSSPYFHYMNGEGVYVMPEVGALCWVCKPSDGTFSQAFLLGFCAPHDDEQGNFRCGRQSLNPGDIMMRTRDENFVILRRGGVVQLGATPLAQRMFIPLGNVIHDFCETYRLDSLGGSLEWKTERTDQTTTGDAPTTLKLLAKTLANDPAQIAQLTIGNHGQGDTRVLELIINESGATGAQAKLTLQIGNDGGVTWDIKGAWQQVVDLDYTVATANGQMTLDSAKEMFLKAQSDMSLETQANMTLAAKANADVTAGAVATVDAPQVKLGGSASEPAVKGLQLLNLLAQMLAQIAAIQQTVPPVPSTAPSIAALAGSLNTILSQKVKVE